MPRRAIADTGPLVAYFDRRERYHDWAVSQFNVLAPPLLISEPVLTETLYLLRHFPSAIDAVLNLLATGVLQIAFSLADSLTGVRALMAKYNDTPMSLADACVVRMSEMNVNHHILTLDSDFLVYRGHGNQILALISPIK